MKTIIAGSRGLKWADVEAATAACPWTAEISEVVSGCAPGVDRLGELWAKRRSIPMRYFPAQWGMYGKSAGPRRNSMMAEYADALVAVWDGESKGTQNMIGQARDRGLRVFVWLKIQRNWCYDSDRK